MSKLSAACVVAGSVLVFSAADANLVKPYAAPVAVLINQVGYDQAAAKNLVVQVRDPEPNQPSTFKLVDESGKTVFQGKLVTRGRIHSGCASDWGARYWTGDFNGFKKSGTYRALVQMGSQDISSFPFRIGKRVVFRQTVEAAARFFYWQRCGFAIPGIHAACHLDDAKIPEKLGGGHRDVTGGWHDAGDYNKYNGFTPHAVYALVTLARGSGPLLTGGVKRRSLKEAKWGADFILKMWQRGTGIMYYNVFAGYHYMGPPERETDNIVGTGDDRPIEGEGPYPMAAAALAALASASHERKYREAAEDLWRGASAALKSSKALPISPARFNSELLLADLEMERLTGERRYYGAARERVERVLALQGSDGLWPPDMVAYGVPPAALAQFSRTHPDDSEDPKVRSALRRWLVQSLRRADNPFEITPWSAGVFFCPSKDMGGLHSVYLSQAWALYLAGDILRDQRAGALADRQIDWVLGENPDDVCFMEGQGSYNLPRYHHAYEGNPNRGQPGIPGQERGAIPGAIPNGLCRRPGSSEDKPWADFAGISYESNEPWLPHNTYYILATLAQAAKQ